MSENKFSASAGLAAWLTERQCSLAFSSYASGMLYFLGEKKGDISLSFRKFGRAMGVAYANGTLFLASDGQIHELENSGNDGDAFDATFFPRRSHLIQRLDCHEIQVGPKGKVFFANTAYSCIATLHRSQSFEVVWKPQFISKIVPEDRCHLNGICLGKDGGFLVSMCNKSDTLEGWRSNRTNGGRIVDTRTGVVADGLSMPHSPRWYGDKVAYLDSGRGFLVIGEKKIFCPGFLRGLSFIDKWAVVTVSLPREGLFHGLELQDNLKERGGEAWCGVLVINIETEAIEHWLRIEGETRELFDVTIMPGIKNPSLIGLNEPTLMNRVSWSAVQ